MRDLIRIPCVLMRGGTSKGPFFLASDLPEDPAQRDALLIAAMGSGHELEIDGIGGGHPVTSKVAIISASERPGIDVDYLFAQVEVAERAVDTSPNCGNMLVAVGPFALDAGLVPARPGTTPVRIHNVNTGKIIEARVCTPDGEVAYDGEVAIDGVPGTAAPVHLAFLEAAGSKTGSLLPTGSPLDVIDGLEISCVDAAMPVVLIRAGDLGKSGYERPSELSGDSAFMARLEQIRIEAGHRMGIPNAEDLVIPKPALVAPAQRGGRLTVRYFTPHLCHSSLAITGSVAISMAAITKGTLAAELGGGLELPADLGLEHPAGRLEVRVEQHPDFEEPIALVVRTARRLFEGSVLVRRSMLGGGAHLARADLGRSGLQPR